MRYAVLADIHGNEYALKAVLDDVKEAGIDKLLLLGDYVGYYYGADVILDLIRQWDFKAIKGNHETLFFRAINDPSYLKEITGKYGSGHEVALKKLKESDLELLRSFPHQLEFSVNDLSILLCHGSPWDNDKYVYPDADEDTLQKYDDRDHDYIFYGHTHYACELRRGHKKIINPGSVGQSRQKGGIAFWGVFDANRNEFEFCQTPYETKPLREIVKDLDPSIPYNYEILCR